MLFNIRCLVSDIDLLNIYHRSWECKNDEFLLSNSMIFILKSIIFVKVETYRNNFCLLWIFCFYHTLYLSIMLPINYVYGRFFWSILLLKHFISDRSFSTIIRWMNYSFSDGDIVASFKIECILNLCILYDDKLRTSEIEWPWKQACTECYNRAFRIRDSDWETVSRSVCAVLLRYLRCSGICTGEYSHTNIG